MKWIHMSDLHIGKRVNGFSMLEDQRYILEQILDLAEAHRVDAVLVAGDVYDRSSPSAEAVALYDWFLAALSERTIPALIVSGNHDMAQSIAFGAGVMERSGIYLSPVYDGRARHVVLEDAYGPVHYHLLPFLRPALVRSAFPEESITSYTDALRTAVEAMEVDERERNILVAHQFVVGAIRSDSEEISVGGTDAVDGGVFDRFDYVALGHLHRAQTVGRDSLRYSGAPLKYAVSEAEDTKSVTLVELREKGDLAVEELPLRPLRDLRRLQGRYGELTLRANYEGKAVEDYLHVVLTDEEVIPEVLGKLRSIYPNIMKLEYANTRTDRDQLAELPETVAETAPEELFAELFRLQNNREPDAAEQAFVRDLAETIWGGRA